MCQVKQYKQSKQLTCEPECFIHEINIQNGCVWIGQASVAACIKLSAGILENIDCTPPTRSCYSYKPCVAENYPRLHFVICIISSQKNAGQKKYIQHHSVLGKLKQPAVTMLALPVFDISHHFYFYPLSFHLCLALTSFF